MSDLPQGVGRDPVRWLGDGPEHAPSGLLDVVVARTRGARQRPLILAAALGAPTGSTTWRPDSRARLWILMAILALAMLSIVAAAGMPLREAIVVRPSSTALESVQLTTSSPQPLPTASAPALEATHESVMGDVLAITIPGGAIRSEGSGQVVVTSLTHRLVIERWPLGEPHTLTDLAGTVNASSLDDLATAITELMHTDASLAGFRQFPKTVDHHPGVEWVAPSARMQAGTPGPFAVVVATYGTMAYAFVGNLEGPASPGLALVTFSSEVASVDFLEPEVVTALGGRLSLTLPGSLYVESSTPNLLTLGPGGFLFSVGQPTIQRVPLGQALTFGTASGVAVNGRSLEEYAAALESADPARFPNALRTTTDVAGVRAYAWTYLTGLDFLGEKVRNSVTIVVEGGDAFLFSGQLDPLEGIRFVP